MYRRLSALAVLLLFASPAFAHDAHERAALLGIPETARLESRPATPRSDALGDADGRWYLGSPPSYAPTITAYDSAGDRFLMFQGERYSSDDPGWQLALEGESPWTRIPRAEGIQPPQAARSAGVLDTRRNRLLVYGGDYGSWQLSVTYQVTFDPAPRWTPLPLRHPEIRPPVRGGAYVAYDSKRDRLIVFGGSNYAGILDDVWALTLGDSMDWQKLHPDGIAPSPRREGTMVYDPVGDRVLLFGGLVQVDERHSEPTDQLWELDLGGAIPQWSLPYTTGDLPFPHAGHAAVWDAASAAMLVVGGWTGSPETPYLFEPASGTWTRLTPAGTPRRATRAPIAYDRLRDRYLLYGGGFYVPDERDVDVLTLRPTPAWSSLPARPVPEGRFGAATILDTKRDRMLAFGGASSRNFESSYRSDIASVDLSRPLEVSTLVPSGAPPSPRHEPVGIYDPLRDRAVFFGGWTYESNYYDDVWILSFDGSTTWSQAHPQGASPPGRRAHAAAYDPLRDRMLVFGGLGVDGLLGDLWALDLDGLTWEKLEPRNEGPGPRLLMSVTYEPARDALLVYGGRAEGSSLGDLWRLRLADLTWERIATVPYTLELERHVASYDAARDRLLVHGGWGIDYDVILSNPWVWEIPLHGDARLRNLRPELSDSRFPDAAASPCEVFDALRDRLVVFSGSSFAFEDNPRSYLQFTTPAPLHARALATALSPNSARIVWEVADQPGATLTAERRAEGGPWISLGVVSTDAHARATVEDADVRAGWRYTYRLRIDSPAGVEESGILVVDIPGATGIDFAGAWPNPARGSELAIWFSLPTASEARIALHDLRGRVVWAETLPAGSAGPRVVRPDVRLPAGLYFAEVTSQGQSARRKITILP